MDSPMPNDSRDGFALQQKKTERQLSNRSGPNAPRHDGLTPKLRGLSWQQRLRIPSDRPAFTGSNTVDAEFDHCSLHDGYSFGFYVLD
jgi:hypothetical protein